MVTVKPIHHLTSILLLPLFVVEFPLSGWICGWKPFWIHVGESFQKAYLEEWIYTSDDSSDEQGLANFPALVQSPSKKSYIPTQNFVVMHLPAPRPAAQPDALPREPIKPQDKAYVWE